MHSVKLVANSDTRPILFSYNMHSSDNVFPDNASPEFINTEVHTGTASHTELRTKFCKLVEFYDSMTDEVIASVFGVTSLPEIEKINFFMWDVLVVQEIDRNVWEASYTEFHTEFGELVDFHQSMTDEVIASVFGVISLPEIEKIKSYMWDVLVMQEIDNSVWKAHTTCQ